jgi:hypothetical protein
MKLNIKYERNETDDDESNILMEKQTIFNRKIPKNASLVFNLNYFKHNDNFTHLYDFDRSSYYFEIELFGEERKLKKVK